MHTEYEKRVQVGRSADDIRAASSKSEVDVWVHFDFKNKPGSMDLDKANAICKLCHAIIKYSVTQPICELALSDTMQIQ